MLPSLSVAFCVNGLLSEFCPYISWFYVEELPVFDYDSLVCCSHSWGIYNSDEIVMECLDLYIHTSMLMILNMVPKPNPEIVWETPDHPK